MLEETDTDRVLAIDVITGTVLAVDTITQKQWVSLLEIVTLFVQVAFIVVVLENVLDVRDVVLT